MKDKEKSVGGIITLEDKKTGYRLAIKGGGEKKHDNDNAGDTFESLENDEGKGEVSEKEIEIKIEDHCNIKQKKFKFIRNGTNIIVGENDVGKTNLLDFIYYKNDKWDGIDGKMHIKNKTGMACDFLVPLFFGNKYIDCRMHSNVYLSDGNASNVKYTCKFYYFDLKTVTSFLGKSREETKVKKLRTHSFYLSSSKNEGWSNVIQVEETIDDC